MYLLMVSLLSRDDRRVSDQREMNPGVWHQIGLELVEVNIESTIKTERGSNGGDNLTNQTIQIGISWPLNIQITTADIVNSLVVNHESTIGMIQSGVGGQDGVVGLHHGRCHLGGGVDGELQLRPFAIIHRETLHQQRGEPRSSSSSERMEDEESLESSAGLGELPDSVQNQVHDLLADGVVAPGVVVGGVLLARDQLKHFKS